MIISHSLKYVYLEIPKTASTSISEVLINEFEGERFGNKHNIVIPVNCTNYYKFCSVRNPYSRAISLYKQAKNHVEHRLHKISYNFEKFIKWTCHKNDPPFINLNSNDYENKLSSGELEREFYKISINDNKGRDLTQVEFLSYFLAINYLQNIDFIIRIEELEENFTKLPFVNKKINIPKLNESKKIKIELKESIKELMYLWSKDDFLIFNYRK